jgi:formate dehydrogenase major subunit
VAGLAAAFGRGSMTNSWTDIDNSTCVIAWGANPSENHPACMAHVNKARAADRGSANLNTAKAKLVVVDPRRTRTALQADDYIRIRPGTDIALLNGIVREIISQMEGTTGAVPQAVKDKFYAHLNHATVSSTTLKNVFKFWTDGTATAAMNATATVPGASLFTDARFITLDDATDYERVRIVAATGVETANPADETTISNYPKRAADCRDPKTVYSRLKTHVDPYSKTVVADICGCTASDIDRLVGYYIDNSRCSSAAANPVDVETATQDPKVDGYRCLTMLYAMGITQHTCGAQNVKAFAVLQTLMGNMGRAGGGINALRGIHNVQGSTDMGLLYGNIPAYSGNPKVQPAADADAFGKYMDGLWGTPLSANNYLATTAYNDAYRTGKMALQQRGFYNMTLKWFGDYATTNAMADVTDADILAKRTPVDTAYSLWPKNDGDDHITMFRAMAAGTTKAAVIWGQNPAVTEPNQGKIREGLKRLDLLVVVDMFETETAACDRKVAADYPEAIDGVTYLIPTAAHVEKAGSVTNSARTLQWRYQARPPVGNTRDDTELLLRLAKELDAAGAFSHIQTANGWAAGAVFTNLYSTPYTGGQFDGRSETGYAACAGTADIVGLRSRKDFPVAAPVTQGAAVTGSEYVTEMIYREMTTGVAGGGTIWIYTGAYNSGASWTTDNKGGSQNVWAVYNRAKSRDNFNDAGTNAFHGWGYSWLVNRRVLYNNGQIPGDVGDFYMGPDSCARLFVSTTTAVLNYAKWYRKVHNMKDKPSPVVAGNTASPHYAGGTVSFAGRFPAHTEPYESPKPALSAATAWGHNTKGTAWDLVKSDTNVAGKTAGYNVADYPYTLTTIRCVEHFQGGPITRNNWWNVELEPEPWIELNSVDAAANGISDGDYVKIITPRNAAFGTGLPLDGTVGELSASYSRALYGKGFRARVGTGLISDQRVAPGVVAIPWHWGDRGLSTGSRANDLCIDAGDANTAIPEYKACLCKIAKHNPTA